MENQRPEYHQSTGMLPNRGTVLFNNRIYATRRSESVSPGTHRPDRCTDTAVRENLKVVLDISYLICVQHKMAND